MSSSNRKNSTSKAGAGSGRNRAAKACLACRHRKVRCDVNKVNQPCTNCKLHSKNCLVVGRASRLYAPIARSIPGQDGLTSLDRATERRRNDRRENPSPKGVEIITPQTVSSAIPGEPGLRNPTSNLSHDGEAVERPHDVYSDSESDKACDGLWDTYAPDLPWGLVNSSNHSSRTGPEENSDSWLSHRANNGSHAAPTVIYSHLRFLTVGNLHRIPSQDVNYLEFQGCLHVPARPMLDDFVEQYYLHIHPLIPLIDEGEFWDMYSQTEREGASDDKMSLLLFQTMLFSSCTVRSYWVLKGFCLHT